MQTIWWADNRPVVLDQTQLPQAEVAVIIETPEQMADAIRRLVVRGAPLIGISAAYGLALSARLHQDSPDFLQAVGQDAQLLSKTRPTAVNLFWALERAMAEIERVYKAAGASAAVDAALLLAEQMKADDLALNRRMGALGQALIDDGDGVLTHCNAGALATGGYGTALGVIRAAVDAGKHIHVYADETRPLLQGARLTAWELARDGIAVTLLTDNMAAALMRSGRVQKVIVGADRIAKNGDTANKIGTYGVALLAQAHGIPFYVAAPESTIDRAIESGEDIPIEMRNSDEVRTFHGIPCAPQGIDVFNPAFDVTPAPLISAIITQKKVYTRDNSFAFAL